MTTVRITTSYIIAHSPTRQDPDHVS